MRLAEIGRACNDDGLCAPLFKMKNDRLLCSPSSRYDAPLRSIEGRPFSFQVSYLMNTPFVHLRPQEGEDGGRGRGRVRPPERKSKGMTERRNDGTEGELKEKEWSGRRKIRGTGGSTRVLSSMLSDSGSLQGPYADASTFKSFFQFSVTPQG